MARATSAWTHHFPSKRISPHCGREGGGALENLCATSQSTSTNVVGLDKSIYEYRVVFKKGNISLKLCLTLSRWTGSNFPTGTLCALYERILWV